jgi:hypothetical protein
VFVAFSDMAGAVAFAQVGDAGLFPLLITDVGIDDAAADELAGAGFEIIRAE